MDEEMTARHGGTGFSTGSAVEAITEECVVGAALCSPLYEDGVPRHDNNRPRRGAPKSYKLSVTSKYTCITETDQSPVCIVMFRHSCLFRSILLAVCVH